MVVFVDVNTREIHIYGDNGIQKIPFHDAHILIDIIGNQKIRYVTNVMETSAEEVVNLVRGISGQRQIASTQRVITPDLEETVQECSYLHSVSKGLLIIPDMNDSPAPGEKGHIRKALVRFEGNGDCKLFDDNMKENIKKSQLLRNLIKKGTIEIIGEKQKNKLLTIRQQDKQRILNQQSARDGALDDIIMDGPVGAWNGEIAGGDIAIEIDVGRRGIGGGEDSHGASTMSELQSMIDGTA